MSALTRVSATAGALLDLEAAFDGDEPSVYWAAGNHTVLGLGAAWEARASGATRFAELRERARELPAWARVFAGFAFAPSGDGAAMPDGWAIVPRVLVERRGERARVTFVAERASRDDLAVALARLLSARAAAHASTPGRVRTDERSFCGLVDTACNRILAHAFEKVVVHAQTRIAVEHAPAASAVLARLVSAQPSTTRYAFRVDGRVFLGATPERLVRLHRGLVSADALAGSRPNGPGDARALLESEKDLAEHRITRDAILAALRPHCARLRAVGPRLRALPHLCHLHTAVRGRLRGATHVLELVEALHPTPAVSGAPLAAALDFLAAHERASRLWYAGPVGWFRPRGEGDFAVALRCALLEPRRVTLYAGAGIVAGSRADRELAEVRSKRRAMAEALGLEAALA